MCHTYLGLTPDVKKVNLDAWRIKACCVLLKKKVNRQQFPKNKAFQKLMHILMGTDEDAEIPDGEDAQDELPQGNWEDFNVGDDAAELAEEGRAGLQSGFTR